MAPDLLLRGPDRVRGRRAQRTGRDRDHAQRRPAAPPSAAQAALSRDAFTPYAALGVSNNDGLAPNESTGALAIACMTVAGYPNGGNAPFDISIGPGELAFSQPWGDWGYLGVAEAEQYGFRVPPGSALSTLGIDFPQPGANPAASPQPSRPRSGSAARSRRTSPTPRRTARWPASRR